MSAELVAVAPGGGIEEYRARVVMAPAEAAALDAALRDNMRAVLHDGDDYGVIPGTGGRPTLLKPGAEKLLQWFGFGHTMSQVEVERDGDGRWEGVTYRCTVTKAQPDGQVVTVASCEGYAGYDEDRFYISAQAAEAKERANAERYQRSPNKAKFVEYRAPRNSVMKMSQKRALVGAALQACGASALFTQDLEDGAGPSQQAAAGPGPVQVIAGAATTAIKALPQPVRQAFNRYAETQKPRKDWSVEDWCQALLRAGYTAAGVEHSGRGEEVVEKEQAASDDQAGASYGTGAPASTVEPSAGRAATNQRAFFAAVKDAGVELPEAHRHLLISEATGGRASSASHLTDADLAAAKALLVRVQAGEVYIEDTPDGPELVESPI